MLVQKGDNLGAEALAIGLELLDYSRGYNGRVGVGEKGRAEGGVGDAGGREGEGV